MSKEFIDQNYQLIKDGKEIAASDAMTYRFDNLFAAGNFIEADQMLLDIDVNLLSAKVLSSILMITYFARKKLHNRMAFFDRTIKACKETYAASDEAIKSLTVRWKG